MASAATLRRRRRTYAVIAALLGLLMAIVVIRDSDDPPQVEAIPTSPDEFIAYAVGPAQAGDVEYGVPASVSLAQAALESNWATSSLTRKGYAFFGIKCGDSPYVATCLEFETTECRADGSCYKTMAEFRAYDSAEDSFRDHGHFLTNNPRYEPAFDHAGNPDQFAREIAKAGYATDPLYAEKLLALMAEYNLYQYDVANT